MARERGIALALLPGECRERDERLIALSTLPERELEALLGYFREGGPANMRALVRRLAGHAGRDVAAAEPQPLPKVGFYEPATGQASDMAPTVAPHSPVVPILFYRSMLLAADVAPIDALAAALDRQGITAAPIFVSSLKDPAVVDFVERAAIALSPAAIVTATAFASGAEPGDETLFDRIGVPVFQAFVATTRRDAWQNGQRGLAPADLAMHVVLPELDGRILAGAIGFKAERETDAALAFRGFYATGPSRIGSNRWPTRIAAMIRLQQTPREQRRIAILMPDYPGAAGRTGYAVGLDVPSSVIAMLHDLKKAGYAVEGIPQSPRALLDLLERGDEGMGVEEYRALAGGLPADAMAAVEAAWGEAG